jgi:diguanylate cyclase (GGDEF)-like protein/PAS domain S-box-containing protein
MVTDEDSRKDIEQEQRRLLKILDSAKDLIALVDKECRLLYLNDAGRKMLEIGQDEALEAMRFDRFYDEKAATEVMHRELPKADLAGHADSETRLRSRSGREVVVSQVIAAHRNAGGAVTHYSIIARDIREHKKLLEHYLLSDKVFTFTAEAIMITDSRNRIVSVNQAFTRMTGYTLEDAKGRDPVFLSAGNLDNNFYAEMWQAIDDTGHWEGELWDRRKDGTFYPKWLSINAVTEPGSGEVTHYIGIFSDITLRKQQEDHIRHLAFHDPLTGLPNRSLFQDRLRHALAESRRDMLPVALMLLDLDHFKYVNDTLGHYMGDRLLKEISLRLVRSVRESDTVARLGGDEFVIILNSIHDLRDVVHVVEKITSELARPISINSHQFRVAASLGIAMYPDDATTIDDLMRCADTAMYHAKGRGRGNYQFFTPRMNEAAHERVMIEEHLRRGLDQQEFELFYQPKISLNPYRLVGCEALLRWNHPDWGMVLPTRFIPVAEDSGLILPLGEWVIDEACRQARKWLDDGLGMQVAVNLSGRQFRDSNLVLKIRQALEGEGGISRWIELEITESTLIEGASHAAQTLHDLHLLSLPLAVDDFGTGYSSLSYLKTFAIDTLKIDKSFVDGIDNDPNDATIIRAVISLAHELGIKVVAEGVEDAGQLRFLKDQHCDMIQGYYFSEPLRADDFEAYAQREFPAAFSSSYN